MKNVKSGYIMAGAVAALLTFSTPTVFAQTNTPQLQQILKGSLTASTEVQTKSLRNFYKQRNYQPVWFDADGDSLEDVAKFANAVQTSALENGLNPADYRFDPILAEKDPMVRDWKITNLIMSYMDDLSAGRIDPKTYDSMIFMQQENEYVDVHMANILKDWSPEKYLQKIEPQQSEYKNMKQALVNLRDTAREGGWPQIQATDVVVYPGGFNPVIAEVRARLAGQDYDGVLPKGSWVDEGQIDGDSLKEAVKTAPEPDDPAVQADAEKDNIYDAALARKVAEFQYMHGKKTDATIGPDTIAAMNVPVEQRIEQLKYAMERWRWFPDNLGEKHVLVNIAGYYVRAVENNQTAFTMPIIVGEVAHQTPVFSSVIKNVKLHPDWVATDSIARRYLIDKIQNNPAVISQLGYQLQRNDGTVVPWESVSLSQLDDLDLGQYRFRQKPGKYNALGLARFSIENDYAIFMHGTPSGGLFNEDARTFSSGCIRVQDPLKMAKFLLKDNADYSESRLEEMYNLGENDHPDTTFMDLDTDVPVYLTYSTAWVDDGGNIHFSDDVYGRDEKLAGVFNTQSAL